MEKKSVLETLRLDYTPKLPKALKNIAAISIKKEKTKKIEKTLQDFFPNTFSQPLISFQLKKKKESVPLKIGVVFSGGQAPGGHNVILGILDALSCLCPKNELFGFLNGPSGILEHQYIKITESQIKNYKNLGGFDLLGSSRTKIETKEQLQQSLDSMKKLDLDGLVIIGGDDSNTNAAMLAEYFLQNQWKTKVIGVPKTIDGDLKNEYMQTSFGFDTASKVYSEMIGNLAKDTLSSKKYYHFIKVMGRSASHLALECALKTRPNYVLIAEEVAKEKKTLQDITKDLADLICQRAEHQKNYGLIVIPEGLIEFIPEMKELIKELNAILTEHVDVLHTVDDFSKKVELIRSYLSKEAAKTFLFLSEKIQQQLLLERDPHGNVQLSRIETEKLLIEMVQKELKNRPSYKGSFHALAHFFGYEGRSAMPSNFDADYCYSLGHVAAILIKENVTGYISCICNLNDSVEHWEGMGIPLVSLMNIEERRGKKKPVIKKALVEVQKESFQKFVKARNNWLIEDRYLSPGAIQYFGPKEITDLHPLTID